MLKFALLAIVTLAVGLTLLFFAVRRFLVPLIRGMRETESDYHSQRPARPARSAQ